MKKQIVIIGIPFMLIVVALCGCNETVIKTDVDKTIGTWKGIQTYNNTAILSTYIFSSDKTYSVTATFSGQTNTLNGTWDIVDNKFVVSSEDQTNSMDYLFSDNGLALTFVDNGMPINLIKQ